LTDYGDVVNITLVTGSSITCNDKPCLNGGECHVYGTSYYCKCHKPYVGIHCEGT